MALITDVSFDTGRVAALVAELEAFYAHVQGDRARIDAVVPALRVPLLRLTKTLVPDARQKIDEYIIAADHALTVRTAQNGADTTDADGNCWEIKVCVLTKSGRCNPCWPVPSVLTGDPPDTTKHAKLLQSVEEKTRGGGVMIDIRTAEHVSIKTYRLSSRFMLAYFQHVRVHDRKSNHNLGCTQCRVCQSFHRLDRMTELDVRMRENTTFTFDQSDAIYGRVAAHCQTAPRRRVKR